MLVTSLLERRAMPSIVPTSLWRSLAGIATPSGQSVNVSNAMQLTAVYSCVSLIAETIAGLPLIIYRRRRDGGKDRAYEHPLFYKLHDQPNPEMTSYEWREAGIGFQLLWGNAYTQLAPDGQGSIDLWPIPANEVSVERTTSGTLFYRHKGKVIPASAMLHVPGLAFDGLSGISPIASARQTIGLALAAEEFGSRWFGNGSRPGGILTFPGNLKEDTRHRLKAEWEQQYGAQNAHRVALLEGGVTWQSIGVPPSDAQFLETRRFQVSEIARLFRVPPHMISDLERSTSWGTGIEQQSIAFVVYTLLPWLRRWEQKMNVRLFAPAERNDYFVEFLVDGLLRGDQKSRYDAYAIARQNGWLNANDIRSLENMNPIAGGNTYFVNSAMTPLDRAGLPVAATPPAQPSSDSAQGTNQAGGNGNAKQAQ